MPKLLDERKRHIRIGMYLKDVVFASSDGIVTTFAIVAGTVGASLSPKIIIVLGVANIFADGISMAAGNYLGTKSEMEFYQRERAIEEKEIDTVPEDEKQEIRDIVTEMGYKNPESETMTGLITSNRKFWLDIMMHKELGLFAPDTKSPLKNALATFLSFVVSGFMPLLPFLFGFNASFETSVIISGVALFTVGSLRSYFSSSSWYRLGFEMLIIGGFAAGVAYTIGLMLSNLVG